MAKFDKGMNTKDPETKVSLRKLQNARPNSGSGFIKRSGSQQKGNKIGSTTKIQGLHSYVKKDNTATLLASFNTDIYKFTESSTPSTIATSTVVQATGYAKDRKVFMTTTVDANGLPYVVVLYQSGAGIKLEWEDTPYNNWSNTPVTVDAATTLNFAGYIDSSDNIHVVWNSATDVVKYVKLTFAAGPTWTAGTTRTVVNGSGAVLYDAPSFTMTSTGNLYVVFRYHDTMTSVYQTATTYSTDSGVTWRDVTLLDGAGTTLSTISHALVLVAGLPIVIRQDVNTTGVYTAYTNISVNTWISQGTINVISAGVQTASTAAATLHQYSVVTNATGYTVYTESSASSNGVTATSYGSSATAQNRFFDVVVDGANDHDIEYKNIIGGVFDQTATRVTNDSNNNNYPVSAATISTGAAFNPVMFTEGTGTPWNIKINAAVQWSALSASLTAGHNVESCIMPLTAAGGTNQIYFVNGSNTAKKWDGTTLTSASATGFPTPAFIFAMDNRLWMNDVTTNALFYTALGADNFTGTFPTTNRLDLPEAPVWGHYYRDFAAFVFTRSSVYLLQNFDYTGASVGPEKIRKIPDSFGTLSGRTVKQVGQWVYYQRSDGQIMRTNGQLAELVSDPIFPTLQSVSLAQLTNAAAGVTGPYYKLSLTASGSGQNDTIVVLDTREAPTGGFSIDTGQYASVFVSHPDNNGVPQLYYGDSRSTIGSVYLSEIGSNDSGSAIDMDVQTGIVTLGDLFYKDKLRDMLVIAEASGSYNLKVSYSKLSNITSFIDYNVSLDPGGSKWGSFVWGAFTWGGSSHVQVPIYNIGIIDRGFKFRYRNNAVDQPVSLLSHTVTFERIKDKI